MNSRKIYATNSIVSFSLFTNEKIKTYIYVPHKRAFKKTFWGEKMIVTGGGWMDKKDVNNYGYPKHLKLPIIKEPNQYFDKKKEKEYYMENDSYRISILESNFYKIFKEKYGEIYFFDYESKPNGLITNINVFFKGYIEFNLSNGEKLFFYLKIDESNYKELLKKVSNLIQTYPFFRKSDDGNLIFLKLDKEDNMIYII